MPLKKNTFAALDLGSNSFHLVIARKENDRLFFLDREKIMVRLADGLDEDNYLNLESQTRAFEALKVFEERIRGFPEVAVKVVGTNTLRAAKNSDDFIEAAEACLGFPIAVINGREEARLVFKGVTGDLEPLEQGRFVIDIGGGSTELIWGRQTPDRLESLHMGCVSFSKKYFPDGEITRELYEEALLAARLEIGPVVELFCHLEPGQALGSSGTIKSIELVLEKMGLLEQGVTRNGMAQLADHLIERGHVKNLNLPGLKEERAPIFPGGVAILHAVLLEIPLPPLHASESALREGVLYEMVGRLENQDQRELTVQDMMVRYSVDPGQAERVAKLSLDLFYQLHGKVPYLENRSKRFLRWAACLHEIGLSLSHSGYHKHGAYVITQSDLAGFNRTDKRILGFLVGNHRRRIRVDKKVGHFEPPWALLLVFRLACLFLRNRHDTYLPPVELTHKPRTITLMIDSGWLKENPLTAKQLEIEGKSWKKKGRKFLVKPV